MKRENKIKSTVNDLDNKVELGEILKSPCLPPGQHFGSKKILKVFMICNNINGNSQTL